MIFTKEIIEKLYDAFNSENVQDPKIIVKIANVAGPGVFYALEGWYERKNVSDGEGKFAVYGLTNIDFSKGEIVYDPIKTTVLVEDFETFNIPFGRVNFQIDDKFKGHVSDAIAELSTLNN